MRRRVVAELEVVEVEAEEMVGGEGEGGSGELEGHRGSGGAG